MKTKSNMIVTKPNNEYAKKLTKKQTKEMIDVIKNTPSPTKPNNNWEIEFDGQFGGLTGEVIDKYDLDAIKLFISKTLQQQREDLIKEIEGIVGEARTIVHKEMFDEEEGELFVSEEEIRERLKQL